MSTRHQEIFMHRAIASKEGHISTVACHTFLDENGAVCPWLHLGAVCAVCAVCVQERAGGCALPSCVAHAGVVGDT